MAVADAHGSTGVWICAMAMALLWYAGMLGTSKEWSAANDPAFSSEGDIGQHSAACALTFPVLIGLITNHKAR